MVGRLLDVGLPIVPLSENQANDKLRKLSHGSNLPFKGIECWRSGFRLVWDSSICCSEYYWNNKRYLSYPVQDSTGKIFCYHGEPTSDWSLSDHCPSWKYFTICGGGIKSVTFADDGEASNGQLVTPKCFSNPVVDGERVNDSLPCLSAIPAPTPSPTPSPTYQATTYPTPSPSTYPTTTYPSTFEEITYSPTPDIVVPGAVGLSCKSTDFSLVNDPNICCSRVSHRIISYPVKDNDGNVYCFADGIYWDMQDHCGSGFFTVCGGDASGVTFSTVGKPNGGTVHSDRTRCFEKIVRGGPLVDPNLPCENPTTSPTIAPTNDEGGSSPLVYIILVVVLVVLLLACSLWRLLICKKKQKEKKKKEEAERQRKEAAAKHGDTIIFNISTGAAAQEGNHTHQQANIHQSGNNTNYTHTPYHVQPETAQTSAGGLNLTNL